MTSGFLIFLKGKICHHNNVKKSNFKLICFCHDRKRGLRREGNNARMLIISLPCYNNWISIAISASKHLSLYIIVLYKIHSYSQFVKWAFIMLKNDLILVLLKEIESQWSIHQICNCTNRMITNILSQTKSFVFSVVVRDLSIF